MIFLWFSSTLGRLRGLCLTDPFHAFTSYPTQTLTPQTTSAMATAVARVQQYLGLAMVNFAAWVLPTDNEVQNGLTHAATPTPVRELVLSLPPGLQASAYRTWIWLVKHGVLDVLAAH